MKNALALCGLLLFLLGCSPQPVSNKPAVTANGPGNGSTPVVAPMNNSASGNTDTSGTGANNFQSKIFMFTVPQPASCTVKEDKDGVVFTCGSERVVMIRFPEIPRIPLPEDRIEDITVSELPAKLYHDTDQKTGADKDIVILDIPNSVDDFYMAGFGPIFDGMVREIEIQ